MRIFGGKNKTDSFKEGIKAALTDGDLEQLELLLSTMGDLPKAVLNDALAQVIENEQIASLNLLIKYGAKPAALDRSVLKQVVYDEQLELFKILAGQGVDFVKHAPNNGVVKDWRLREEATWAEVYHARLASLQERTKNQRLMEEIQVLKKELTGKKAAPEAPESSHPSFTIPKI